MTQHPETFPDRVTRIQKEQTLGPARARHIALQEVADERIKRAAETAALAESLRRQSTNPQSIADPSKGQP